MMIIVNDLDSLSRFKCIKEFYTHNIKILRASDLSSYFKVKEYIEENNVTLKELFDSVYKDSVCLKVTSDDVTKEFYILADAAKYMEVSPATVYYAHNNKNEMIRRRKGGTKVFYIF